MFSPKRGVACRTISEIPSGISEDKQWLPIIEKAKQRSLERVQGKKKEIIC